MKVLADEDVGVFFVTLLKQRLDPEGIDVVRVANMGWDGTPNGSLALMAVRDGFTHLVSFDKRMAEDRPPVMPVLLVDKMGKAEVDRARASAFAVAERLIHEPPSQPGYYGVSVEGYEPTKRLVRVLEGLHKMHPNHIALRERRRQEKDKSKGR